MPLLDGKQVDASAIDPAKHKFIGMWRPPESSVWDTSILNTLPRRERIDYRDAHRNDHLSWREGVYDEPQYVTMETEHGHAST
jgi:hypothetical protein